MDLFDELEIFFSWEATKKVKRLLKKNDSISIIKILLEEAKRTNKRRLDYCRKCKSI